MYVSIALDHCSDCKYLFCMNLTVRVLLYCAASCGIREQGNEGIKNHLKACVSIPSKTTTTELMMSPVSVISLMRTCGGQILN